MSPLAKINPEVEIAAAREEANRALEQARYEAERDRYAQDPANIARDHDEANRLTAKAEEAALNWKARLKGRLKRGWMKRTQYHDELFEKVVYDGKTYEEHKKQRRF